MTSNILDIQLFNKKKYIVLFSGLEFSPIEKIVNEIAKDFNAVVLNFLHLNFDDTLEPVNIRVNDLIKKQQNSPSPQAFFIIGKSFPFSMLKFPTDLHINISLHKFAILKLDPAKRSDLPDVYVKLLESNRINKYINLKKDFNEDQVINEIFNLIIDDIEKKLYGDKYNILSHKYYKDNLIISNSSNSSKLSFNPTSLSQIEIKNKATLYAEKEIQDSIDDIEDSISAEKNEDDDDNDFLKDEIRIFGSR